jgi:hypothetical protein
MKVLFTAFLQVLLINSILAQSEGPYSQDYLDASTKFAWMTFGGDINYFSGGSLSNARLDEEWAYTVLPRLTIGGVHFWGHADLYVSFPLSFLRAQDVSERTASMDVFHGIETGIRLYPLKLQANRLAPFMGVSFRRIGFEWEEEGSNSPNGAPSFGRFIHPIQMGLTYSTDRWHFSASAYYHGFNEFRYYNQFDETVSVQWDPLSFNLSLLRYIDTDAGWREKGAAAQINTQYDRLKRAGKLSTWFLGIGPSAALQMSKSPYLRENHPQLYNDYSATILPDVSFGYYFYEPDLNLNVTYRTYGDQFEGLQDDISTRRHSVGIESVKFLFNWLGFVPFAGAAVTYEDLSTTVNGQRYSRQTPAVGLVFGWDIRVTQTGTSLLRTNLRYFPNLHMNIEGEKMMFDHLEFNFIQWVTFLGRGKAYRQPQ